MHESGLYIQLQELNLGPNKLKAILSALSNVSRRYELLPSAVWAHPKIDAILALSTLSPLDRYKRLSAQLRGWQREGEPEWRRSPLLKTRHGMSLARAPRPEQLLPSLIYLDPPVADTRIAREILERFPHIPVETTPHFEAMTRSLPLSQGKKTWVLTAYKGKSFKTCPAFGKDLLCCNYFTFDVVSHCPLECSYCILQSYLKTQPAIHIYTNLDDILADIGRGIDAQPDRYFRIGTGELADSLALDPLIQVNRHLINFFARKPNAVLELKTKSPFVDHLLDLDHNGHTVIAWSINPAEIIQSEEFKTASFEERLAAANRAIAAGYKVAFHVDPIIVDAQDEGASLAPYERMIDAIGAAVSAQHIAWVSMGTLRFPRELKEVAEARLPKTKIYTGEFVREGSRFYYPPERRERIFKRLWDRFAQYLKTEQLYLCMEGRETWSAVDPSCHSVQQLETRLTESFTA